MRIFTIKIVMSKPKDERQSIYIITNPQFKMVKVGVSKRVSKRLMEVQNACGCKLELSYRSLVFSNAVELELEIHKKFTEDRVYGEWFTTPLNEILEYTMEIVKGGILDERIEMYINGESISSMAKRIGISRQAIISYLKYYDSYNVGADNIEKKRISKDLSPEPVVEPLVITPTSGKLTKVPLVDFSKLGGKYIRVADNLYANSDGYLVKYWEAGAFVEKRYPDRESVLADNKINT